ncbi:peptidase C26 [Gluconacetobacter diazotrophicus PA1 5]|uniref:Gamma-glutamyl-gamma-aminobutyrate hydrolase family protein n=2 Tax=Gluconacetobacter diazotrophicus TaxID=33996 RepID=A0A7W4NI48_GLUDI|nr:gamma-glutamyl-gamma-aminobutyrate hydrolase family protein [Gluconacetobacter diazotrophicus]ACI51770.1 peptidase C26 [Gluconacetobacter diazotrophicus PA1 5]MBB2158157.1 gamma-glutamyl-gamma-aminobutyrate hydrolase family protein [Gluconacetobacter diazotrophicus]TWB11114.1 putative glutamine amidotransferase [Gluconacetobacter diazotrophicus]CAP55244.1 putative Gamma-glutamyl-gamma-aminobutyrate hydrolase [Gluconacetobacter diazotrophicus PA1 5]
MSSSRPLIGVTLDSEPGTPQGGGYSRYPWYALRRNYLDAVADAGGIPVALPHCADLAPDILARLDGLVVTGGAFDVDPALYGADTRHATVTLKSDRTRAELALTRGAIARDMPLLGICGGQQLLAVALGGSLVQHIPDAIPGALPHEQPNPRHEAGHQVAITPGTLLARVTQAARIAVNSAHHQAVRTPGEAIVCAIAPDGVVEAIEHPARRFCLGVQWHPEFAISVADRRIFAALIETSGSR